MPTNHPPLPPEGGTPNGSPPGTPISRMAPQPQHPCPELCLTGWRKGAQSVAAILAIREHSALGLAQAKSAVESCLANQTPIVPVPSMAKASALIAALASAGFAAEIRHGG